MASLAALMLAAAPKLAQSIADERRAAGDEAAAKLIEAEAPALIQSTLEALERDEHEKHQRGRSEHIAHIATSLLAGTMQLPFDKREQASLARRAVELAVAVLNEAEAESLGARLRSVPAEETETPKS
jgi:hypothetical protein